MHHKCTKCTVRPRACVFLPVAVRLCVPVSLCVSIVEHTYSHVDRGAYPPPQFLRQPWSIQLDLTCPAELHAQRSAELHDQRYCGRRRRAGLPNNLILRQTTHDVTDAQDLRGLQDRCHEGDYEGSRGETRPQVQHLFKMVIHPLALYA
jgi:hypothetical protein